MPEPRIAAAVTQLSPGWGAAVLVVLGLLLSLAAVLDGALPAAPEGRRVGGARPFGEVARLMRQRRRTTVEADTMLWRVGGAGLLVVAALMLAVVPLGHWTVLDLDVGIVWFNAMDVAVWALVWLTGWGANSAYGLVGGYRFLALGLGYELPLMFALVAPAIAAKSLNVAQVAGAQQALWFAVWMPVAFAVYLVGVSGFAVWGPFAPAVGSDVAGGARAELSGVDRLVFEAGRYGLLAAGSAFAVPMFLGGGGGPLLPAAVWVVLKTVVVLAVLVWLRRRLPAFRPDKLMEVGWLILLPLVLVQDLVVAVVAAGGS